MRTNALAPVSGPNHSSTSRRFVSMKSIFTFHRSAAIAALAFLSTSALADSAAAPVPVTVLKPAEHTAHGLVFLTPNGPATGSHGTQIIDDAGRPVWFRS